MGTLLPSFPEPSKSFLSLPAASPWGSHRHPLCLDLIFFLFLSPRLRPLRPLLSSRCPANRVTFQKCRTRQAPPCPGFRVSPHCSWDPVKLSSLLSRLSWSSRLPFAHRPPALASHKTPNLTPSLCLAPVLGSQPPSEGQSLQASLRQNAKFPFLLAEHLVPSATRVPDFMGTHARFTPCTLNSAIPVGCLTSARCAKEKKKKSWRLICS